MKQSIILPPGSILDVAYAFGAVEEGVTNAYKVFRITGTDAEETENLSWALMYITTCALVHERRIPDA